MRPSQRRADQLRPLGFTRDFARYAEGSVLAEFGATQVLCTASVPAIAPPTSLVWVHPTKRT